MIKIMVVDDNALVRRAVCETIDWAAMGCEIEGRLTNGIEGFQYAKEHHPDIIITDIKMPGMDGLEMVIVMVGHSQIKGKPEAFGGRILIDPRNVCGDGENVYKL